MRPRRSTSVACVASARAGGIGRLARNWIIEQSSLSNPRSTVYSLTSVPTKSVAPTMSTIEIASWTTTSALPRRPCPCARTSLSDGLSDTRTACSAGIETGHGAGDERNGRGEGEHAPIRRHRQRDGVSRGEQREQRAAQPVRQQQPRGAAKARQHQRFGQQLAHETAAPGANRQPNGDLALPRGPAREQSPARLTHASRRMSATMPITMSGAMPISPR